MEQACIDFKKYVLEFIENFAECFEGFNHLQLKLLRDKLEEKFSGDSEDIAASDAFNYCWFFLASIQKILKVIQGKNIDSIEPKDLIDAPCVLEGTFNVDFQKIFNQEGFSEENKRAILAHLKICGTIAHGFCSEVLRNMGQKFKRPEISNFSWVTLLAESPEDIREAFADYAEDKEDEILSKLEIDEEKVTRIKGAMENMLCGMVEERDKKEKTKRVIDITVDKLKDTDIRKVISSMLNIRKTGNDKFIEKLMEETKSAIELELGSEEEIEKVNDLGIELMEKMAESNTPMGRMVSSMLKNVKAKLEKDGGEEEISKEVMVEENFEEDWNKKIIEDRAKEIMELSTSMLSETKQKRRRKKKNKR